MTDCRHCRTSIPKGASVCPQCNRSQGYFSAKLESGAPTISVVSIILSIVLVILSWLQFREATKQRISADRAVQSAGDALTQALKASAEAKVATVEAQRARDETRNTVEHLRTNIKLVLEMQYLTPSIVRSSYDPVKVGKVRQKLEEFAVPNEQEREKWLESLKQKARSTD